MEYKLCSVLADFPNGIAKSIIQWGHDHIPDSDVYEAPGHGREEDTHVTVLYGIKGDCLSLVKSVCQQFEAFTIELGALSLFTTDPKFDVLMIEVESPDLREMNRQLKAKTPHIETHPIYRPHTTIAYLDKGRGWKFEGDDAFKGRLVHVDTVMFSDRHGVRTPIRLR